jgi:hypothetical protein
MTRDDRIENDAERLTTRFEAGSPVGEACKRPMEVVQESWRMCWRNLGMRGKNRKECVVHSKACSKTEKWKRLGQGQNNSTIYTVILAVGSIMMCIERS